MKIGFEMQELDNIFSPLRGVVGLFHTSSQKTLTHF